MGAYAIFHALESAPVLLQSNLLPFFHLPAALAGMGAGARFLTCGNGLLFADNIPAFFRAFFADLFMQAFLKFSRAVDWLNTLVGKYVIWLILGPTLISAGNALVRKVFNVSSNALLEVQ